VKRKKLFIAVLVLAALLIPILRSGNVNADGSAYVSLSAAASVTNGQNVAVSAYVSSISGTSGGGVGNFQGTFAYDSTSFDYVGFSPGISGVSYTPASGRFYWAQSGSMINGSATMFTITLRAKKVGTSTVSLSGLAIGDGLARTVAVSGSFARSITVNPPPSSNANLGSLSVTGYSISPGFSAGNTSYSLSVGSSVTSAKINASTADAGARVSGTGTVGLGYGDNRFYVTVTAPAGNNKTYVITINRKDNRSSDNKLKSLTPSTGSINFSPNTTSYSMEVPFAVTRVNFTAYANDSKAKVSVSSPGLIAEQTVTATITVTAENGAQRVYRVNIKRGKDPNKPVSAEDRLESLSPSIGILSPAFSPDITNYAVYLPFEVSSVSFKYTPKEKTYETIKQVGSNNLKVGINKITFKATAENGHIKEYVITVYRFGKVGTKAANSLIVPQNTAPVAAKPKKAGFDIIPYLIGGAVSLALCVTGGFIWYIIKKKKRSDKKGTKPWKHLLKSQKNPKE